ncbi:acetylcholinesterase-like [Actinia tenebrosa]|uniref:Carboxylic ester hydrolase n=1 Tax=Actinia tenebrosa TaxID=6105 RepID=A0A6P8HQJ5_ACTTE|nr:acetylcholinesterase-like [Actinia tenebrosa]
MTHAIKYLFVLSHVSSLILSEGVKESSTNFPVIELEAGQVRGKRDSVAKGQDIDLFIGIPYAQPPTGELRFAAPQPAKPWKGILNATEYGAQCPQEETIGRGILAGTKSEDCLFLNIYRPAIIKENTTLAVMVWIHGGGLYHGSGSLYDGSVLASYNDVIVVTINYRLGLLGFLTIPGTELTGNYGMLDQVMALKWVKENIRSFGGNPDQVTLFGNSAGGSSTDLHILSPLSKGLFQKTIAQSGFATTAYVTVSSKHSRRYAHFADKLNCKDKKQMLSCLRSVTVEEITKAQGICDYLKLGSHLPVQIVDGVFLPDKPSVLLSQGRFNPIEAVMFGANKDEGVSKLHGVHPDPNVPPSRDSFLKTFNSIFFMGEEANDITKDAILYKYTNHTEPDSKENLLKNWRDLITDSWYISRAVFSAQNYAKAGIKTYLYRFSHNSKYSTYPQPIPGVYHFDEVQYIFGVPWKHNTYVSKATSYTDVERGLSASMMRLWANFAKYGNPSNLDNDLTPWPKYNTDSQEYLDIDLEPSIKRKIRADHVAFWNDFVPKLNNFDCHPDKKKDKNAARQRQEL